MKTNPVHNICFVALGLAGNAIMPPGKGATNWQDDIWFPTSPLKGAQKRRSRFDLGGRKS